MQKQCPGKFHGSAIKYIDESQKYCVFCQQQIDLQKAERKEKAKKVGGTIVKIGAGALAIITTVANLVSIFSGKPGSAPKKDI